MEVDYETSIPDDGQSEGVTHDLLQYGGAVPTDAELQVCVGNQICVCAVEWLV